MVGRTPSSDAADPQKRRPRSISLSGGFCSIGLSGGPPPRPELNMRWQSLCAGQRSLFAGTRPIRRGSAAWREPAAGHGVGSHPEGWHDGHRAGQPVQRGPLQGSKAPPRCLLLGSALPSGGTGSAGALVAHGGGGKRGASTRRCSNSGCAGWAPAQLRPPRECRLWPLGKSAVPQGSTGNRCTL